MGAGEQKILGGGGAGEEAEWVFILPSTMVGRRSKYGF